MNLALDLPNSTYRFACNSHPWVEHSINILTPMGERPKCSICGDKLTPVWKYPGTVDITDAEVTPSQAKLWLKQAHPGSLERLNQELIEYYAALMHSGKWVGMTQELGGHMYPIYFQNGELVLGIQRLKACILADKPFQTVIVRSFNNY